MKTIDKQFTKLWTIVLLFDGFFVACSIEGEIIPGYFGKFSFSLKAIYLILKVVQTSHTQCDFESQRCVDSHSGTFAFWYSY